MTINVANSDGSRTITIRDGTADASTSIHLFGRHYENYSQQAAENALRMLESFASDSPPERPVAGQLWFRRRDGSLRVCTDASGPVWRAAGGGAIAVGNGGTMPLLGGVPEGQMVLDARNSANVRLLIKQGGAWKVLVANLHDQGSSAAPTGARAMAREGTDGASHGTVEFMVDGVTIGLFSMTEFTPADSETHAAGTGAGDFAGPGGDFPAVRRGLNIKANGDFRIHGVASEALFADLAERFRADGPMPPGTLVALGGSAEITKTKKFLDPGVFGVVSENPAYMMNAGAGDDGTHPCVALSGRVPVNAVGPVSKGDRMISSNEEGCAMSALLRDAPGLDWRCVFGRALEDKDSPGIGPVEVVVGVK